MPRRDRIRSKVKTLKSSDELSISSQSPELSPALQLSPESSPGSPMLDAPVPMLSSSHTRFQYHVPESPSFFCPFSDQSITWDWPNLVNSGQHTAHAASSVHSTTSTVFNVAAAAVASAAGYSLMNEDSLDQSLDFVDFCQSPTPQIALAPNELQYCFDHRSSQEQGNGFGIAYDGYPPLLDSSSSCSNPNMSMSLTNVNLSLLGLGLDMPGLCPLQLDRLM